MRIQLKRNMIRNKARQRRYLKQGIVMLPTLREERKAQRHVLEAEKKGCEKKNG